MRPVIALLLCAGIAHADDKRCVVEKPPVVASNPRPAACHRAPAKVAAQVRAEIEKAYQPERGGTPEIKFPCDGLGKRIHEIVIETGGGHAGTLALWRAKRRADGKYDAHGIMSLRTMLTRKDSTTSHEQAAGIVELPDLDKARAAMTATVREVVPPPKPGEGYGVSSSFSSRDFHLVLRLVDDEGHVLEKRYTGYSTSAGQDTILGLEIAARALDPITSLSPNTAPADSDDRDFFSASFNATLPHFDEPGFFWVMERYVDLARFLGTRAVIGGLLTRLSVIEPSRSKLDARADAVEALANITGWDARAGGKSVEDAAAAYLRECK